MAPCLHEENIFGEVVGITDWQSSRLAPLFEHAGQSCFLDYEGPSLIGIERPRFPENVAQLDSVAWR